MSCAACAARIEKAVSGVCGVTACSVNLLTNSMTVDGTAAESDIINAVNDAGYGAKPNTESGISADALTDRETPVLKKRLLASIGFLTVLLYITMGHGMLSLPLPRFISGNYAALGIIQLVLAAVIIVINRKFFISGAKSVLHGAPNMDTLVALGSGVSFLWSVYTLIKIINGSAELYGKLYFESAAMILVLITVGKMLEARSKGKTTDALKSLISLAPKTAAVIRGGAEITIPADELKAGDIFTVRPGESIPADAVITEGSAAIDESALTGESIPADKSEGDSVFAATINKTGFIKCRAERIGSDTTLAQIIKTVSDTAAAKAPIAKTADKVAGVFVPAVTGIAAVTLAVWLLLGKGFDYALARAISVLVISCPCALGLATPVAVMAGSGVGAKHGILFKTAVSLEETGKIKIAVLDKTGTVTTGEPQVTKIIPSEDITENDFLKAAYSLEIKSEHPLSRAIVSEAESRGLIAEDVTDFKVIAGKGLCGKIAGDEIRCGSVKFISSKINGKYMPELAQSEAESGCTPLLFEKNGKLLGIISVADTVKPDSAEAVKALKDMGISVVMLTGDNKCTAEAMAKETGIEHIVAGILPNGKAAVIEKLKSLGKVAMVGDGINDAPALTAADTGIAIGAGADIAVDSADVVLMNSRLTDVCAAIRLSRQTLKNIRENLFWAFFYNALCIPLAAGCYVGIFGWELNPMIAAAAMSLSSLCVVCNALRLNLFKANTKNNKAETHKPVENGVLASVIEEINAETEEKTLTKTLKIDGMMCRHCEAHVKKALEALDGVESAAANFEDGTAVVTLTKDVADNILKEAVEAQDYAVISII